MSRRTPRIIRRIRVASRLLSFAKHRAPVGAAPGTLAVAPESPPPDIHLIAYTESGVEERDVPDASALTAELDRDGVVWVDVQGLGDETVLRTIGDVFGLHPLALEDAVNVPQRPKSEAYERQQLFITRMVRLGETGEITAEQISVFIGRNYVLTLQELPGDVLDTVRARIRAGKGQIRRLGADYLAYAIIDTVIDGYYPVIEALGEQMHALEDRILFRPSPEGMRRVHRMRRDLLALRRAVWPQREAVQALIREDSPLVSSAVREYLRDCHDHAVHIADVLETYRELASSLMDLYLSSMSQRTNEVMKVLTIMSSIFIPLTFLAGLYGMNFRYLPELGVHWAYPALLLVMLAIALAMVMYFRGRGWIGRREPPGEDDDT